MSILTFDFSGDLAPYLGILHCAALVAEYLSLETSEFSDILPQSLDEFQELSDNILEESAVSDDTIKFVTKFL